MPSRRYWATVACGVAPTQRPVAMAASQSSNVAGVLYGGPGALGPQVEGGRAGAAVDDEGAGGQLGEADTAPAGPGVVGGERDMAALVADGGVGPGPQVDGGTDDGQIAQALGEAAGGGVPVWR
jgi:hypothetical protein